MQEEVSAATAMLGLDGFVVLAVSQRDGELKQAIETASREDFCRGCGVQARLHDRRPTYVRDLPSTGRPVTLAWVKRVWQRVEPRCPAVTWSETSPGIRSRASLTEQSRVEACRRVGQDGHSVTQVSAVFGVAGGRVMACVRIAIRVLVAYRHTCAYRICRSRVVNVLLSGTDSNTKGRTAAHSVHARWAVIPILDGKGWPTVELGRRRWRWLRARSADASVPTDSPSLLEHGASADRLRPLVRTGPVGAHPRVLHTAHKERVRWGSALHDWGRRSNPAKASRIVTLSSSTSVCAAADIASMRSPVRVP